MSFYNVTPISKVTTATFSFKDKSLETDYMDEPIEINNGWILKKKIDDRDPDKKQSISFITCFETEGYSSIRESILYFELEDEIDYRNITPVIVDEDGTLVKCEWNANNTEFFMPLRNIERINYAGGTEDFIYVVGRYLKVYRPDENCTTPANRTSVVFAYIRNTITLNPIEHKLYSDELMLVQLLSTPDDGKSVFKVSMLNLSSQAIKHLVDQGCGVMLHKTSDNFPFIKRINNAGKLYSVTHSTTETIFTKHGTLKVVGAIIHIDTYPDGSIEIIHKFKDGLCSIGSITLESGESPRYFYHTRFTEIAHPLALSKNGLIHALQKNLVLQYYKPNRKYPSNSSAASYQGAYSEIITCFGIVSQDEDGAYFERKVDSRYITGYEIQNITLMLNLFDGTTIAYRFSLRNILQNFPTHVIVYVDQLKDFMKMANSKNFEINDFLRLGPPVDTDMMRPASIIRQDGNGNLIRY